MKIYTDNNSEAYEKKLEDLGYNVSGYPVAGRIDYRLQIRRDGKGDINKIDFTASVNGGDASDERKAAVEFARKGFSSVVGRLAPKVMSPLFRYEKGGKSVEGVLPEYQLAQSMISSGELIMIGFGVTALSVEDVRREYIKIVENFVKTANAIEESRTTVYKPRLYGIEAMDPIYIWPDMTESGEWAKNFTPDRFEDLRLQGEIDASCDYDKFIRVMKVAVKTESEWPVCENVDDFKRAMTVAEYQKRIDEGKLKGVLFPVYQETLTKRYISKGLQWANCGKDKSLINIEEVLSYL